MKVKGGGQRLDSSSIDSSFVLLWRQDRSPDASADDKPLFLEEKLNEEEKEPVFSFFLTEEIIMRLQEWHRHPLLFREWNTSDSKAFWCVMEIERKEDQVRDIDVCWIKSCRGSFGGRRRQKWIARKQLLQETQESTTHTEKSERTKNDVEKERWRNQVEKRKGTHVSLSLFVARGRKNSCEREKSRFYGCNNRQSSLQSQE